MPITGAIPLPKTGMEAFDEARAQSIKNKLMGAQMQEAEASAGQKGLISQLMNIAYGEGQQGQPGAMQPQNYSSAPLVNSQEAAQAKQPMSDRQQRARDILERFGYTKPTYAEQKQLEVESAWQKELASSAVKTMQEWDKTITASHEAQPNLENIQEIQSNPIYQNMYKNPEYFGKDIEFLSRFGTPQERELLAKMDTNVKNLYQSTASEFKGAFREFEKKLFDEAVPKKTDTLEAQIAKNNTILALRKLASDRLTLAQDIVRSSKGAISPANALALADKQIGAKEIFKQVEDNFKKMAKEQKVSNEAKEMITIRNKNTGETKTISKSDYEAGKY